MNQKQLKITVPNILQQFSLNATQQQNQGQRDVIRQQVQLEQFPNTDQMEKFILQFDQPKYGLEDCFATCIIVGWLPKINRYIVLIRYDDQFHLDQVSPAFLFRTNLNKEFQPCTEKVQIIKSLFYVDKEVHDPTKYLQLNQQVDQRYYHPQVKRNVESSYLSNLLRLKTQQRVFKEFEMYPNVKSELKEQLQAEVDKLFQQSVSIAYNITQKADIVIINDLFAQRYQIVEEINENRRHLIDSFPFYQEKLLSSEKGEAPLHSFTYLDHNLANVMQSFLDNGAEQKQAVTDLIARNQLTKQQLSSNIIFQPLFIKYQNQYFVILKKAIEVLQNCVISGDYPLIIEELLNFLQKQCVTTKNSSFKHVLLFLFNQIWEEFNVYNSIQQKLYSQKEIDEYVQQQITAGTYQQLPFSQAFYHFYDKILQFSCFVFVVQMHELIQKPMKCFYRIFCNVIEPFLRDTMWISFDEICNKYITLPVHNKDEEVVQLLREDDDLLQQIDESIDQNEIRNKKIKQKFTDLRKQHILLMENLYQVGFNTDVSGYLSFPFHILIDLIQDQQQTGLLNILSIPSVRDCMTYYNLFINQLLQRHYKLQIEPFLDLDIIMLDGKVQKLRRILSSYLVENKTYISEYYADQSIQFICLPVNMVLEEFSNLDQQLQQFESILQMTSDIIMENFNIDVEQQIIDDFLQQGTMKNIRSLTSQLYQQNQNFQQQVEYTGSFDCIDIFSIQLCQIVLDKNSLLPIELDLVNIILNFKIQNKKIFSSLFSNYLYYFLFQVRTEVINDYYTKILQNFKDKLFQNIKLLLVNYCQEILNQIKLIYYTMKENEVNPQKLGHVIQLRRIFSNEVIIQYYNYLFHFIQDSSLQLIHIFGNVDEQQNDLISVIFNEVLKLNQLEQYIVLRNNNKQFASSDYEHDLQFYRIDQLTDRHKQQFDKFQSLLVNVKLNFLDNQQIVLSAFHRLIREIKLASGIQKQRSKCYLTYISITKGWLMKHLAGLVFFIQNSMFSNIQEIAQMNDGTSQFQLSQQFITNDLHLISLDQYVVLQKLEKISFYEFPSILLEYNLLNCNQVDLKFEAEFVTQFQMYTKLPLVSLNLESLKKIGFSQNEFDFLGNQFIKDILNIAQKNSTQFNVSDNFVKYAVSVNKVVTVLEEFIILFKQLDQWQNWLQETKEEKFKETPFIENIKRIVLNICPLQKTINAFFIIMFIYQCSKKHPLNVFPYEDFKFYFSSFMENIISFKTNYRQFHMYLITESIRFDSRFLEILDHLSRTLLELVKPYHILNVYLNPYILPVQLNETQKLFDFFIDAGLQQNVEDIINVLNSNGQFYQYSLSVQEQIINNQSAYASLKEIYKVMASFKLEIQSVPNYQFQFQQDVFSIAIQPPNFINTITQFQLYLYILLNKNQKQIASQVLILARDIENIILNCREFYYIMQRFPFLLYDMQLVRNNGSIIEVDFNELEDKFIEQQLKSLKSGKLKRKYSLIRQSSLILPDQQNLSPIQQAIRRLKQKMLLYKQMQQDARLHKINLLSTQEINIISQAHNHMIQFFNNFKNSNLITISTKYVELQKFQKYTSDLFQIAKRLLMETYSNVFRIFQNYQQNRLSNQAITETQTQYDIYDIGEQKSINMMTYENINLDREIQVKNNSRTDNYKEFKLMQNQLVITQYPPTGIVIPSINGQFYFQMLVYDTPIMSKFSDFKNWNILFQKDGQLNKLFFENVDNFLIEDSPIRGKIMTQLTSGQESLIFNIPVKCPKVLFQLPDILGQAVNHSFNCQSKEAASLLERNEFQSFLNNTPYQIQLIALHMVNVSIVIQLKQFIQVMKQKPNTYIPIMCRIQELSQLDSAQRIQYEIKNEILQLAHYEIPYYNIYFGQPQQIENFQIQVYHYNVIIRLLASIQQRQTIFLCDTVNPTVQSQKQLDYIFINLSRFLGRKTTKIQFTEHAFYSQIRSFLKYICAGYLVQFYNVDILQPMQIAILCDLCLCIQNKQGILNSMFVSDINQHKINQIIHKRLNNLQLTTDDHLAEQDLIMRNADVKDFGDNLGYYFFIVNCVDDVPQHQFEMIKNIKASFLQLEDSENLSAIFNQFSNFQLINMLQTTEQVENHILKEFLSVNPAHGLYYYQLSRILSQFDVKFQTLNAQDIAMLMDMCKNPTDPYMMGVLLLDYILRQYFDFKIHSKVINQKFIQGFQDHSDFHIISQMRLKRQIRSDVTPDFQMQQMNSNFIMLSNIIESVLGLRKQKDKKAVTLTEQARAYCQMVNRDTKSGKQHQVNFRLYFEKFLATALADQVQQQIIVQINLSNRVPLGMSYEIFMLCHILGRFKQQVLLTCQNQSYAKLVGTYLQNFGAVGKRQTLFATNNFDLMSHRRVATPADILFCIPTSIPEFKKMALTLKQIELQANAPRILVLMPNILEFTQADFNFVNTFQRRLTLIPDLLDQLGLAQFMICNKKFDLSTTKFQMFDQSVLFDVSERYAYSTATIISHSLNIHTKIFRLKLLWQIFSGFFTGMFQEMISANFIGSQIEEFMIIRSIFDFFMLKFNVFTIVKSNQKANIDVTQEQPAETNEYITSIIFNDLNKNHSERSPKFYGMLQTMLRQYQLDHQTTAASFSGFNQEDLISQQEKISNIMKNLPTAISRNDQSLILEILLNNTSGVGIGNQGSLIYNFNEQFVMKYVLQPESTYQAMFNIFQPIAVALFDAFYLLCQFNTALFIPVKRYDTFVEMFRKHEPEKFKRDMMANHFLFQPLQLIVYEHNKNYQLCDAITVKNKYSIQQNIIKSFYDLMGKKLPDNFPDRQFSYLHFVNPNDPFVFQTYLCGKGILSQIEIHKFIQLFSKKEMSKKQKEVNLFGVDENIELESMNMWQSEEEEVEEKLDAGERLKQLITAQTNSLQSQVQNEMLQEQQSQQLDASQEKDDEAPSEIQSTQSFTTIQFAKVQGDIKVTEFQQLFTEQFASLHQNKIDIQQIEQVIPLYFDDERLSLAVLLACSMLTPITFALTGNRFTGKSNIINLAKLIIRDICMVHTATFNELSSEASTSCLQQSIVKYYQMCKFPIIESTVNEQVYISEILLNDENLPFIMANYYSEQLSFYDNYVKNDLLTGQSNQQQFKLLLTMNNKMQKVNQVVDEKEALQKQFQPRFQEIIDQKCRQINLLLYTETLGYPCFHLQCSCFDHQKTLSDNVVSLLKDHTVQLNNLQAPTFLSNMTIDSFQNRQIGQVVLSDTSFILEVSLDSDDDILPILRNINIIFKMPKINMSYLRKYFRYMLVNKRTTMPEEWVQSFLNGMNLIKGCLPINLFKNYQFFRILLKDELFHLPSFKKLVIESKRQTKLSQKIAINEQMRNMRADLWLFLVSNYDNYNKAYETQLSKGGRKIDFMTFLKGNLEQLSSSQPQKQQISQIQTVMAVNQDDVFKSLSIYSLISNLKQEGCNNIRVLNSLERFTSLYLLGYLEQERFKPVEEDDTKFQLNHPWQDTQQYKQLYPSFQAVMVQLCLKAFKSQTISQAHAIQTSLTNQYALKLFNNQSSLLIDYEKLLKKLPLRKVFTGFLNPLPKSQEIVFLFEKFLNDHAYKNLYHSGLIASGLHQPNSFFIAHMLQLYQGCAEQLDPMILISLYKLYLEILTTKQYNASVIQTSIQTYTAFAIDQTALTGHHANDYLRNYKLFVIGILQQFATDKVMNNDNKLKKKKNIIMNSARSTGDDHDMDENAQEDEIVVQEFNGFQETMLMSLKIPKFILRLNTNSSPNQYNLFIQYLEYVSQYKILSSDTFKKTMTNMAAVENDVDISDNQSVLSKGSKYSATSALSKVSGTGKFVADEYQAEIDEIRKVNQDESVDLTVLTFKQYQFLNTSKQEGKFIIDISNLIQTLNISSQSQQKKNKKQKDESVTTGDLISGLKQFLYEVQQNSQLSVDGVEYLLVLQIFRYSILLALGIKPSSVFNNQSSILNQNRLMTQYNSHAQVIGLSINSSLQTVVPQTKNLLGKLYGEIGQLPYQLSSQLSSRLDYYKEKLLDYEADENPTFYNVISGISYPDISEPVVNFLSGPYDILIITPCSILQRKSQTGISLENTINQALQTNTFIQSLFDYEELSYIIKLMSVSLDFNYMFDLKALNALLSVCFSIVMIDDSPEIFAEENEYGSSTLNKDNIENLGQVNNIIESAVNSLAIDKLTKTETINEEDDSVTYLKFNSINFRYHDLLKLYKISSCALPMEVGVSARYNYDSVRARLEYAHCAVSVYKQIMEITNCWSISFYEFTNVASTIVNHIYTQILEFFNNVNYLYVIFHFFECLSSPTQTKAKMVDMFSYNKQTITNNLMNGLKEIESGRSILSSFGFDSAFVNSVKQLLKLNDEEAVEKIISKKYKTRDINVQLFLSVGEAYYARDYIFTVMEFLKSSMKIYQEALQSAHLDGIIIACYLYFYQTGMLQDQKIYQILQTAKFPKLFGNCEQLVSLLNEKPLDYIQQNFDIFQIFVTAVMQDSGFHGDIKTTGIPLVQLGSAQQDQTQEQVTHSQQNPLYLLGHMCIPNQVQNYFIHLSAFDYPVLLILKQLNMKYKNDDPDLVNLYNLSIFSKVLNKNTFLVEQGMLLPTACMLEAFRRQEVSGESYQKNNEEILMEVKLDSNKSLTSEFLKKLHMIDMLLPPQEFNTQLARVLQMTDSLIIFANFGPQANMNNCAQVRKFLQLRSRKLILKRQTINIGNSSAFTGQALHKFQIIISFQVDKCNILQQLDATGLLTQEFVDQLVVVGKIFNSSGKQELQISNENIITQSIVESVFGEINTKRYYLEGYRNILCKKRLGLAKLKEHIQKYFSYNIFDIMIDKWQDKLQKYQSKTVTVKVQQQDDDETNKVVATNNFAVIPDEVFLECTNQLISSPPVIIQTALGVSFILSSSQQQFDEFWQMCLVLLQVVTCEFQQQQYSFIINSGQDNQEKNQVLPYRSTKSQKHYLDFQNKPSIALTSSKKIIQSIGHDYCYQIALCLSYAIDFVQGLSQKYIQLQYLLSQNLINSLCQEIKNNLPFLIQKSQDLNHLQTKNNNEKIKPGWVIIPDLYPLAYTLGYEKQIVNEFLVAIILPALQKLLCPCLDSYSSASLYFFINCIFFSVFQQDECFKTKTQISDFVSLIIHSMHSTDVDDYRMFTAFQILSVFSKKSRFAAAEELYLLQETVEDIKPLLPEITQMSEILQEAWVKLISLQSNPIIEDSLPWFLKHHSSFVSMNQCSHLFCAFLCFYQRYQPAIVSRYIGSIVTFTKDEIVEEEIHDDNSEKQEKIENKDEKEPKQIEGKQEPEEEEQQEQEKQKKQQIDQTFATRFANIMIQQKTEQKQLTQLPPLLQLPSPQVFYAILLICNLLQPNYMNDNVQIYQHLMAGYLDIQQTLNQQLIMKEHYPSVINQNTGVIRDGTFTVQYERSRNINKLTSDFSPIYTSFMKFISPNLNINEFLKFSSHLISENMFIISECLYIAANELQKYVSKVKETMQRSDYDPQKHYQYINRCGSTPDNIFVIFYDEKMDVKQLFQFIYNNIDIKIMRNIPLMFTSFFDIQKMRDMLYLSIVNPLYGGIEIMKNVVDVFNQKKTVYPHILILPVFIFIPIQAKQLDEQTHQRFMYQFMRFINITNPTFAFLHQHKSLPQSFSHAMVTLLGVYNNFILQNKQKLIAANDISIAMIKILFRSVFLQIQQNVNAFDSELINLANSLLFKQQIAAPVDLNRDISDVLFIQQLQDKMDLSSSIQEIVSCFLMTILTKRYQSYNLSGQKIKIDDDLLNQELLLELQHESGDEQVKLEDLYADPETEIADQALQNNESIDLDAEFNRDDDEEFEIEDNNENDQFNTVDTVISGTSFNINKFNNDQDDFFEDSFYSNIIDQLQLYETHLELQNLLNLEQIEQSIIKLIKCQKRNLKIKSLDIYFNQIAKIIGKMIEEFSQQNQRVVETVFSLLARIMGFLQRHIKLIKNEAQQQSYSFRTFMSSQIVQMQVYEQLFKYMPKDQLPPLLQYFISNIPHHDYYRMASKQFSAKVLFAQIVNPSLNNDANAVIGFRQFCGYQNEWVFNVSQYINSLASVFTFIRFRNSILLNTRLSQQHIILIIDKQEKMPSIDIDGNLLFMSSTNHEATEAFTYVLREVELVGAAYDTTLETFCDENYESLIGYRQIFDVFLYCLTSDCKQVLVPKNYVSLPLIVNHNAIGQVFIKNQCEYEEFELAMKRAHFTVTKI